MSEPAHAGKFQSADGQWWEISEQRLLPSMFGTVGTANDIDILIAAFDCAALIGAPLYLTRHHKIVPTLGKTLRYRSGLRVHFEVGASLEWDVYGLPCVWGQNDDNVIIYNPIFIWSGIFSSGGNPPVAVAFSDALGRGPGTFVGANNCTAAFACFGGNDVRLHNPTFKSSDTSHVTSLMPTTSYWTNRPDGSRSKGCGHIGLTTLDGYLMGPLFGAQDGFSLGDGVSRRYGNLDPAVFLALSAPTHAIYGTPQTAGALPSINTTCGSWVDHGEKVAGTHPSACRSFKFAGAFDGLTCGALTSKRASGILEIDGTNAQIGNMHWTGAEGSGQTIHPVDVSGGLTNSQLGRTTLNFPTDASNVRGFALRLSTGETFVRSVNLGDIIINYDGPGAGLTAYIEGNLNDCSAKLTVNAPNNTTANQRLVLLTGEGSRNVFEININLSESGPVRAIENCRVIARRPSGMPSQTTAIVRDVKTGSVREISRGASRYRINLSMALDCTDGSTSLSGPVIPRGGTLLSCVSLSTVALGGTKGATGWKVGTAADDDQFGVRNSLSQFGPTTQASWTDFTLFRPSANTPIIVTAIGGPFDGTGKILLSTSYDFSTTDDQLL